MLVRKSLWFNNNINKHNKKFVNLFFSLSGNKERQESTLKNCENLSNLTLRKLKERKLKYQNPLAFLFLSLIHWSELVIWILQFLYRSPLLVYKKEILIKGVLRVSAMAIQLILTKLEVNFCFLHNLSF